MADLINVTPEKLKATASSFQQAGKDVKKTTSDMLQLVRGISSSIWSGEASSIYLGKFNGLDADIAKMCKMIEEESQHLTTIAQEYQLAEEQNKQVAATLKNKISLLETLGNSLNSMWEGAAKEKYVKQLKTDISKMRNLLKTILEFILILEKIIAIYNKAEKKNEATAVS